MSQLSIFSKPVLKKSSVTWSLFIDGASRGNPGHGGVGIYIFNKDKEIKKGFYVGKKTNNQAEYLALIIGLFVVSEHMHSDDHLEIKSDSQLLVRQIIGVYKVKDLELKKLFNIAMSLLPKHFKICHIPREENTVADSMANLGIDKKISMPEEFKEKFKKMWQSYENL